MRKHRTFVILLSLIVLILVIGVLGIVANQFNGDYQSLNKTDQLVLSELEQYFSSEKEHPMWEGYRLSEKTIVAINGRFGSAYIINPKESIKNLFVKEIKMPNYYGIHVYRIAITAPQLWQFRGLGNFNSLESTYKIFGNEVYYTRYSTDSVGDRPYQSQHYITFLAHESFHYYMQTNWTRSGRFSTESVSDTDLDLLEEQYAIFEKMQLELGKASKDVTTLKLLCKDYVAVVERRLAQNPEYVNEELQAETEEGTATYVGIKASKAVSYPFDVMCFEQNGESVEHLSFNTVISAIKQDAMSISSLSTNFVYETGALLCQVLDVIMTNNWQVQLNQQTTDYQVTLFSILKAYISEK